MINKNIRQPTNTHKQTTNKIKQTTKPIIFLTPSLNPKLKLKKQFFRTKIDPTFSLFDLIFFQRSYVKQIEQYISSQPQRPH